MTLVSPSQSNPNDEITADAINGPVNQIAAVINGNIDSTNISSVSGAKLQAGTVAAAAMDTNSNPETRMSESLGDYVASGCVWSAVSGLNGTMTLGVVYIGGKRIAVSAVASKTFTASKDTYVYVDNTGSIQYDAQVNGAAQPNTPANNLLLAKVVTSGAAITSVSDIKATGISVQSISSSYSAVATGTTILPADDTIPQITEGIEFMTVTITPKYATSKLAIDIVALAANSVANDINIALFRDSTANAIAAQSEYSNVANGQVNLRLAADLISGSTAPTTFRVRIGGTVAGTTTFNGVSGGRRFGGINLSTIRVTEYRA